MSGSMDVRNRRPPWFAQPRPATGRFLVRIVYFGAMTGVGYVCGCWMPRIDPYDPSLGWSELALTGPSSLLLLMWFGGAIGLVVMLYTGGRRPHWDCGATVAVTRSMDMRDRPPARFAQLRAVIRFLAKAIFFTAVISIGGAGAYCLPHIDPYSPQVTWTDVATIGPMGICLFMFFGGHVGLAVTLFTGGRRPRWK